MSSSSVYGMIRFRGVLPGRRPPGSPVSSRTPSPRAMRMSSPLLFIGPLLLLLLILLLLLHPEDSLKREQKAGVKAGVNMHLGGGERRRKNDQRDPPFPDKGALPQSCCGSHPPKNPSHTQAMTPTPKSEEEALVVVGRQREAEAGREGPRPSQCAAGRNNGILFSSFVDSGGT